MTVTDENYKDVLNAGQPVVIDFGAEWCGPCSMISPIIDELAIEYEGKVIIGKVNVDDNNDIATQFGIRTIPTILFFKEGKIVDKYVGAAPKNVLADKIKGLLL